jgi:hypothetical protein
MNKNEKNYRTARIVSQLGMPQGTATGRLRKNILFHLLKKLNENICFKCKTSIKGVEDLSIEHVKPWENVDPNLFWDLDNIAFSHLRCNTRQSKPNTVVTALRKTGPTGTSWCGRHKLFLPESNFSGNKSRWNGLHGLCKDCQHYMRDRNQLKSNGFQFGVGVNGNTSGLEPEDFRSES